MKKFGIIGNPLTHSFSSKFFSEKFQSLNIDAQYFNFPISSIEEFPELLKTHSNLEGLNVTMPYKVQIIQYLTYISDEAKKIGCVNVVKIIRDNKNLKLIGYNTDIIGFINSLSPMIKPHHKKALILGTGGAAATVAYGLSLLGIEYSFVSRFSSENSLTYNLLTADIINAHKLIVNTTPLGMYPDNEQFPDIPYIGFSNKHLAYDLIYNPETTKFMENASKHNAIIKNGYEMFILQAEEALKILVHPQ